MNRHLILLILVILCFIAAGVSGVLGWRKSQESTVIVEWETASELDTVGFNLYRSESTAEPYVKVNETMIAASTDPLIGGKYSFVDQAVAPGQVYYYELEDVDINGNGSRFGPIQVTAEYNGRYELISAAILGLTGMTGVYYTRKMAIEQKRRAV